MPARHVTLELEVLEPGLLTTVQDAGRPDWTHLGVPVGGAADPWSLAIANLLVGNGPGAAGLEAIATGPRLRAIGGVELALAGADLGARVEPGGRAVRPGHAVALEAGQELVLPGPSSPGGGFRAYVAVAGGLDVPAVLGSRSTCLVGHFGGLAGRPLAAGDRLTAGRSTRGAPAGVERASDLPWPGPAIAPCEVGPGGAALLRVLPGLAGGASSRAGAVSAALTGTSWTVGPSSDRMGLRLEPAGVAAAPTQSAHLVSHGVTRGVVQLPPDGRPIVLLADHQPTGGYPVVGVVASADLPALGQLGPGSALRFAAIDRPAALEALRARRASWDEAVLTLRADRTWAELWRSAGG